MEAGCEEDSMNVLLGLRELSTAGTWIWTHKGGKAIYVKYDQTPDLTGCTRSSCERGDIPPHNLCLNQNI